MKRQFLFLLTVLLPFILLDCHAGTPSDEGTKTAGSEAVIQLGNDGFKKLIFNYEVNKEWKYEGNKPAIIDFYADWCPPCKALSPRVEEIAKEYSGKIVVYRVNTDKESVLAQALGISQLPTLLFIPKEGKPQITVGALPKETLVKAINEVLLIK
jgi:thioredoxin 1